MLLLPSPALLPADALSAALRALPGALPGMDRPALLCDALTDAVSGGGVGHSQQLKQQEQEQEGATTPATPAAPSPPSSPPSPLLLSASAHATAVAALSALFELIVRHGLEYPVRLEVELFLFPKERERARERERESERARTTEKRRRKKTHSFEGKKNDFFF